MHSDQKVQELNQPMSSSQPMEPKYKGIKLLAEHMLQ